MSVEEIKKSLAELSAAERSEVTAFLFHMRHATDAEYQAKIAAVESDKNPQHWLTPEEFEKRLDEP
jgi:hypothetical protein